MDGWRSRHLFKTAIWGLFLIAIGVLFLLERMGAPGFAHLYAWWPLVLVVAAVSTLFDGRVGNSVMLLLLAGWFFAVTWGWHGLTYGNSWPLVLVAVGAGMVVRALTGEDRRWRHMRRWRHARWRHAEHWGDHEDSRTEGGPR